MQPLGVDDPQVIGAYRLLGRLGAGGMGRVYLGRSQGGRTVAVKAVHAHFAADEEFRARFRREVAAARRVGGAWTAPVLDADPDAPVPWVATGYVAGPSLSQAVAAYGPLPAHTVRALGAGLAEALAAVHALGLVHRDVKPSNVLLTVDGPLLIDFGIARAMDGTASLTSSGVSIGSPGYMSPEQILGKGAGGASDVFSLGAVLAFAATGAGPFSGDSSAALLYKVVHEPPELGPSLTGDLRELAEDCLSKTPAERPAPQALAARLAGERSAEGAADAGPGAAGLVRAGWLPGPLLEQVGRQAVELLNLDAAALAPGGPAASAPPHTTPAGGFGPPDPSYAAASGLVPFDTGNGSGGNGPAHDRIPGQGPPPASGPAHVPGQVPAHVPGRAPGQTSGRPGTPAPWPTAGHAPAPGVPAVSDAPGMPTAPALPSPATAAPSDAPKERRIGLVGGFTTKGGKGVDGAKGRPRRVSCTLVLSVAGVLAAATSAVFVFNLLPGDGGRGDSGAARPPAGDRATPSASGPAQASLVPKAFLGSWSGTVRMSENGDFPNGTMTSTITPGGKGDYVVHTTYDASLLQCTAKAKLVSATGTRLILEERSDGKQGPGCTGTKARVTYTAGKDGRLSFTSDDAAGGKPAATLTKGGG